MTADTIIALLARHAPELREAGVTRLSIFGSRARGDGDSSSDVDVAMRLTDAAREGGLAYIGRIERLRSRLESLVGVSVDIVVEPVGTPALRAAIRADERVAFE